VSVKKAVENVLAVAVIGAFIPLPEEIITYPLAAGAGLAGVSVLDIVKKIK
jgi:hypothetical protein